MEPTRIFDLMDRYLALFPDKQDALAKKTRQGWIKYSIQDYKAHVDNLSLGLLALGVKAGDRIATVTDNRPEWNFFDMAMAQIGVVHVPVYPTIGEEEYLFILNHSEARYLVIGSRALYKKIKPLADEVKSVKDIYTLDRVEGANFWKLIYELGQKHTEDYRKKLNERRKAVGENDMATIIYTSGTTGLSKGVMLSHRNIIQNVFPGQKQMPLYNQDRILSFLPLCHVYERMLNYIYHYKGISIYYAQNMGTIKNDLVEIRANGFSTVPRLLEKVHEAIIKKGKEQPLHIRKIFERAVKVAENFDYYKLKNPWYRRQYNLLDKLVFKHWRNALGGNIKFVGCGGAALGIRLNRFFHAAGINIQEGYGLTETSPLVAFNFTTYPNKRFGTVGLILENEEVKIAEDGEILVKGPNVMLGYFKEPELTKEAIDQDGWFHTGDIGTFVDGKFLKITDRKKEMFKTSAGKYISPQTIENRLKQSFYISQALVVGENERFAAALISPNFNDLRQWAVSNGVGFEDDKELVKSEKVFKFIEKEINKINKTLGDVEKIVRFRLVCHEWAPETGELSPTLKPKRKFLYRQYASLLEEIYGHPHQPSLLATEDDSQREAQSDVKTRGKGTRFKKKADKK